MMLLTVIPYRATSFASVRAKPVTAARRLFDRISPSTGCFTAIDVTLMMRPHCRSFMPGSTSRVSSTALRRVSSTACCHASQSCASNGPDGGPPAFVTRTSTRPKRSRACAHARLIPSGVDTSAATASTSTPALSAIADPVSASASSPRAQITSDAPSAASASAMARPRPRLAAATSATFPRSPRSMASSQPLLSAAQVGVGLVEPVLTRRREDVDVHRVLERFGLVRNVGGDVEHLTGPYEQLFLLVLSDPEPENAFEDVRQLLVLV